MLDGTESSTSSGLKNENNNEPEKEVLESSISLPEFWEENIPLWFIQVETLFQLRRVTSDKQQFCYVISKLQRNILPLVEDIIRNPPDANKYKTLKEAVLNRTSESEQRRIETLIQTMEMGNQKPSSFHREMLKKLIKTLWISRLPSNIRMILVAFEDDTIERFKCCVLILLKQKLYYSFYTFFISVLDYN